MNKKISEFLKKLTISILLLIFSFVLLTPTANALEYDPKLRKSVIKPNGDDEPFGVDKVNDGSIYFYNSIIFYWNLFIIETLEKPHIIDIEKEQYEPKRDTETTRPTQVQTGYSGSR